MSSLRRQGAWSVVVLGGGIWGGVFAISGAVIGASLEPKRSLGCNLRNNPAFIRAIVCRWPWHADGAAKADALVGKGSS